MSRSFVGGSADKVAIGDVAAVDITGTVLSLHCWANPSAIAQGMVFAKWDGALAGAQYLIQWADDGVTARFQAAICDGVAVDAVTKAGTVGRWQPVGLRLSGGNLDVWVDGSNSSIASALSIQNTATALNLGWSIVDSVTFGGKIAEAAIWDAGLSDAEFAALAAGTSPQQIRPASLKGYWPLWGVSGTEIDLSANRNNGTVTGATRADHTPTTPPQLGV